MENEREKIIEVIGLTKKYKIRDIMKNLRGNRIKVGIEKASFEVYEGEIFSIIGLNGAGKTTIMKCILGLLEKDSGTIKIFGKEKLSKDDFYNIGYLPEISYYPKEVKLYDLLNYYGSLYDMDFKKRKKEIQEILEILDLNGKEKIPLSEFSKGMLQRVGIAQAIMNDPKLLFLDEPMAGLDPMGRKMVTNLLLKLKKQGRTIILNTHILSDVEKLGGRVLIIDKAKVKKIISCDYAHEKDTIYRIITKEPYPNSLYYEGEYIKRSKINGVSEVLNDMKRLNIPVSRIEIEKHDLEKMFLDEIN